jgi:hypothetical protein
LPAGPAVLEFSNGVDTAAVVIAVDAGALGVLNVSASDNVRIDTNRPAKPGEVLNVLATGLTEGGAVPDAKLVRVHIAGVEQAQVGITPMGGAHQVLVSSVLRLAPGKFPLWSPLRGGVRRRTTFLFRSKARKYPTLGLVLVMRVRAGGDYAPALRYRTADVLEPDRCVMDCEAVT